MISLLNLHVYDRMDTADRSIPISFWKYTLNQMSHLAEKYIEDSFIILTFECDNNNMHLEIIHIITTILHLRQQLPSHNDNSETNLYI